MSKFWRARMAQQPQTKPLFIPPNAVQSLRGALVNQGSHVRSRVSPLFGRDYKPKSLDNCQGKNGDYDVLRWGWRLCCAQCVNSKGATSLQT